MGLDSSFSRYGRVSKMRSGGEAVREVVSFEEGVEVEV